MSVRTNLHPDPRYIGVDAVVPGGIFTQSDSPTNAPDGGGHTFITMTADAPGDIQVGTGSEDLIAVTPGLPYTASVYCSRGSRQIPYFRIYLNWYDSGGTFLGRDLAEMADPNGGFHRLSVTGTAPATAAEARVHAVFGYEAGADNLVTGDVIRVAQRMVEQTDEPLDYFDGSYADTTLALHAWTGPENASTSTQTTADIVATLLTTDQPQPVQVLVTDLQAGVEYEVVGQALDGRSWAVPGGQGVSDGGQIRLVDNRAPVNAPVSYTLTVLGASATSNTVEVPWAPGGDASNRYLIQSLDGQRVVPVRQWQDNGLPRTHPSHTATFDVHNRRRPVVVLSPGGVGETTAVVVLDRAAGEVLDEILGEGGAVCVRTSGDVRDLNPSDIAVILEPSSVLYGGDGGVSTSRVWTLPLRWIDDPEPSTVPVVWSVGDVDALLAGTTVAEVDAMFAGQSVGDVDATDWGQI